MTTQSTDPAANGPSFSTTNPPTTTYRLGTPDDSYAVFRIMMMGVIDMLQRMGHHDPNDPMTEEKLCKIWPQRQGFYQHLAATAENFWVAEQDEEIIGLARTIRRAGTQELTEFFVKPGIQSGGIGKALLGRAFPTGEAKHRSIIATPDVRAQVNYLRSGVTARFPLYEFSRQPEIRPYSTDLIIQPLSTDEAAVEMISQIDEHILGYRRDVDHRWLLSDRQGFLYHRSGQPVGYGYVGHFSGPFGLLKSDDFPAVLSHAETWAAQQEQRFHLAIPSLNQTAVNHCIQHRFHLDPFYTFVMSDKEFGRFTNYIVTTPEYFL